ncbi:ankyrin repeat-containing domain protein [Mycena polygramma]|nr:ankyrin repeat-containing domain protein [Mycena polygramma]
MAGVDASNCEWDRWIVVCTSWLRARCSPVTPLSSSIIETVRGRGEACAFFYFETTNSEQRTITHLLCSLLMQLSVQLVSQDQTLHALWKSYADGQHGLPADSTLISKALIPLLREFNEPVYIVLDALDEALDRRQKLLDSITDIVDAQLPNMRLLVTSRAEVRFKAPLADRGVAVSLDGCVDRDIECAVDATLSEETEWPAARKDAVKTKLLGRSSGMQVLLFRLVSLQLNDLRSRGWTLSKMDEAVSGMPASLPDFYDRILKDITNPEMVANVCRTISWLIASRRPMELVELVDALAFDFGNKPLRFDRDARMSASVLVAACAGFISISDDVVKIAHSSVTEYFLSSRKFKDSLDGYADVRFNSAHFLLAQTCVAYLCSLDPGTLFETIPSDYALGEYASENWGFHAKLVLDLPPDADEDVQQDLSVSARTELLDRIFELLVPGSLQYISLCRLQKQPGSTPPLFVAAYSGIYAVLVELLKGGADVNTRQGPNGSVLRAASERGHTRIVQLLLERGADVNMEEVSGNALQAASTRGHAEIVQLLLENGANVNVNAVSNKALHAASAGVQLSVATAQLLPKNEAGVNAKGGEFSSALKAASARGHTEIVNLLLRHGADPNADGGISGTALQVASAFGHTEIVHLLLEKGADMNVAGGRAGNALVASSAAGHTEIVQLLLDNGADANAGGGEQGDALQVACAIGHTEIVQLLLKNGASVNAKGGEFGTALQAASARGHTGIVHLLVENGAEVNKRAEGVHNALQVASANT